MAHFSEFEPVAQIVVEAEFEPVVQIFVEAKEIETCLSEFEPGARTELEALDPEAPKTFRATAGALCTCGHGPTAHHERPFHGCKVGVGT